MNFYWFRLRSALLDFLLCLVVLPMRCIFTVLSSELIDIMVFKQIKAKQNMANSTFLLFPIGEGEQGKHFSWSDCEWVMHWLQYLMWFCKREGGIIHKLQGGVSFAESFKVKEAGKQAPVFLIICFLSQKINLGNSDKHRATSVH